MNIYSGKYWLVINYLVVVKLVFIKWFFQELHSRLKGPSYTDAFKCKRKFALKVTTDLPQKKISNLAITYPYKEIAFKISYPCIQPHRLAGGDVLFIHIHDENRNWRRRESPLIDIRLLVSGKTPSL